MNFSSDPLLTPVNMDFYDRSFVVGEPHSERLRIRYYFRSQDGRLFATIETGRKAQGPPGCVHGGASAAIMDDAMGVMIWLNHHAVLTANLNVNYKKPFVLEQPAVLEAWIEKVQGRKVFAAAEIRSGDSVLVQASGLFIDVNIENFKDRREALRKQYGF